MKISEMITDRYKLRLSPTVYYDLLADVQELEEEEPTTKNGSSELDKNSKKLEKDFGELDCISRKAVIDELKRYFHDEYYQRTSIQDCRDCFIEDVLKHLPTVTPQPRKGHWIKGYTFPDGEYWKCDKCNELIKVKYPMYYCNNCGSDNSREVEE